MSGTISAFSIFQGIEKPRDSAGITELRADLSYPCNQHCDAGVPFELFQYTFTGMRALLFVSGSSPAATEARHTSHRALRTDWVLPRLKASSSAFCPSQTPFILMFPDCELAGCFTPGWLEQGLLQLHAARGGGRGEISGTKTISSVFQGKESRLWVQGHPQQGEGSPCCKAKPLEVAPRTKSPLPSPGSCQDPASTQNISKCLGRPVPAAASPGPAHKQGSCSGLWPPSQSSGSPRSLLC